MFLHCNAKERAQRTFATDTDIRHVSKRLLRDLGRQNSDSIGFDILSMRWTMKSVLNSTDSMGFLWVGQDLRTLLADAPAPFRCQLDGRLPLGRRSRRFGDSFETDPRIMKPVPHRNATSKQL